STSGRRWHVLPGSTASRKCPSWRRAASSPWVSSGGDASGRPWPRRRLARSLPSGSRSPSWVPSIWRCGRITERFPTTSWRSCGRCATPTWSRFLKGRPLRVGGSLRKTARAHAHRPREETAQPTGCAVVFSVLGAEPVRLVLDPARRQAFDEVLLQEQEQEGNGGGGDDGARRHAAQVGLERVVQVEQPGRQRVHVRNPQDDERPQEVVPEGDELKQHQ